MIVSKIKDTINKVNIKFELIYVKIRGNIDNEINSFRREVIKIYNTKAKKLRKQIVSKQQNKNIRVVGILSLE